MTLRHKIGLGPSPFPLKVSSNGRYFTTQQDVPLFINGATPWSLSHNLTLAECRTALDALRAKNFNAVIFSTTDTFGETFGANYPDNLPDKNGNSPFSSGLTPYEPYWQHIDAVLEECRAREMVVFLSAAYHGYNDEEGIRTLLAAQSDATCYAFGEFLGTRYGGLGNIVWTHGGDCDPTAYDTQTNAIRDGIEATDPDAIHGTHWGSNTDPWAYSGTMAVADLDVWNAYEYGSVGSRVNDLYNHATVKPTILFESHYESDWASKTAADIRSYPYRAVLSGACGHFMGNAPLWWCGDDSGGWSAAISSTGHTYMSYVPRLFNGSRPWWKLVPQRPGTLLVSGYGDPDTDTGAQAGLSQDGELAMVFYPSALNVTVSLAQLDAGSSCIASWFNCSTGALSQIGLYATSGNQAFQAPGADYVLVLEQG